MRELESGPHAGKFLYWFYNNQACGYDPGSRNPVWLLGGVEKDSPEGNVLHWGRPEVAWTGGESLAELAGRPLRLVFELKDADVFSFRTVT